MITTVEGLRHGQMVESIQGRDCRQYYLIIGLIGDKYLLLVDGHKHPLAKPKRKNIKHVRVTMYVAKDIEERVLRGEPLSNSQIKSALERLKNQHEEGSRFNG
ncbi:MAG: RNA-binding protein [Firmicutes bacterium]|nr:RNA-binding protein [Bacillota bacterium]